MKVSIWGAVAALCLTAPAFAENSSFDYSFLDLGYTDIQYDDSDTDADGFGVRGSFKLTDNLNLIGSFGTGGVDDFDIDVKKYTIGAGLHWPLNRNLDILTTLNYINIDTDLPFGGADDEGVQIGVGLRGRLAEQLELTGGLTHTELDYGGNDTSPTVGLRYSFNKNFAILGDVSWFDGGNQYFLGGRLNLR